MDLVIWIIGVLLIIYIVDKIMLAMESRGWVYWRKRKPSSAVSSSAFGELIDAFQPSQQIIQEERQKIEAGVDYDNSDLNSES